MAFTWVSKGRRAGSSCPVTGSWAYKGKVYGGNKNIGMYKETTVHILAESVYGECDHYATSLRSLRSTILLRSVMVDLRMPSPNKQNPEDQYTNSMVMVSGGNFR